MKALVFLPGMLQAGQLVYKTAIRRNAKHLPKPPALPDTVLVKPLIDSDKSGEAAFSAKTPLDKNTILDAE